MAGTLHISLFDYHDFMREAGVLVAQVDLHNFEPLRQHVLDARHILISRWPWSDPAVPESREDKDTYSPEKTWPLYEHGEPKAILEEADVYGVIIPTQRELGYWFLIVLAKYLKPCPTLGKGWWDLDKALSTLGWNTQERDTLFRGLPLYKLIKAQWMAEQGYPLTETSPYWLWIRPNWAQSGWLPLELVAQLYQRLLRADRQINELSTSQEFTRLLVPTYQLMLSILEEATGSHQGLFISVTSYA